MTAGEDDAEVSAQAPKVPLSFNPLAPKCQCQRWFNFYISPCFNFHISSVLTFIFPLF